ncbi:S41 family peptidase [Elizabethkingia bruuniana]|uniref:S41 family peptidase n=1 Tax=Elizabethkingia bruuniana TaxID=1756149 RepID=UPI0009996E98|nr:S41 family peptidase [Elizabethkingia bruuniana]OPC59025.1 peptidase S41 protein [Elizabethkingia bruuniana]
MKKTFILILLLNLCVQFYAQNKLSSKDSIDTFYNQLFKNLKTSYLYKNDVNWKGVITETNQNLSKYDNFNSSLSEIEPLFNKIGATHCNIYYKDKVYSSSIKSINEKLSDEWEKAYTSKPSFKTKVINNEFGYILIPKIIFSDISEKNVHRIAQPLYDEIADLKSKNNLKGWIIDLRFNTGGNSWPMLLALYDFLGNNDINGSLNIDKKQINKIKLDKGVYYNNSKKVSYITPHGQLLDQAKVAVITSAATGSSGEIVALSFKGRANTIFIGQETFGATTGNIKSSLPFGSYMALTTSYDCDRNGNYYKTISPDIVILKEDNFENLLLDKNIQEAIKYIIRV